MVVEKEGLKGTIVTTEHNTTSLTLRCISEAA